MWYCNQSKRNRHSRKFFIISITPCQSSQQNMRDQSISLQLQKPSCELLVQEREIQPMGRRLRSLSHNQSQFAPGGASGRCECKEHSSRPCPPRMLRNRFVSCRGWLRSQPGAHHRDSARTRQQLTSCGPTGKKGQSTREQLLLRNF